MNNPLKSICFFIFWLVLTDAALAQFSISGTVFESTKTIPVKNVVVKSSSGIMTTTDSAGRYTIACVQKDSLTFIYHNKATNWFAVKQIENMSSFDISIHITLNDRFKTLKEVKVFSKNYQQDSIANREEYAKAFNYHKPGIATNSSPYSGTPGLDLDEFINIFRFKRNKSLKHLQTKVLEQEQESYISYRFNKNLIRRITHLDGINLNDFLVRYIPSFEFTQFSTLPNFYQYILNSSYQFKKERNIETVAEEAP